MRTLRRPLPSYRGAIVRRLTADALVARAAPDSRLQASGEQRLVAAVLERSLRDPKRGDREARAWIASDAPSAFSFVACCSVLDVDPSVRAQVRALRRAREEDSG